MLIRSSNYLLLSFTLHTKSPANKPWLYPKHKKNAPVREREGNKVWCQEVPECFILKAFFLWLRKLVLQEFLECYLVQNQVMVRCTTNFLAQYFSIFLSIITALRKLQSYQSSRDLRKHTETRKMGTCCVTIDGSACCKRAVWGQDPTPVVLSWEEDTASVTILFLINLFLCMERSSVKGCLPWNATKDKN